MLIRVAQQFREQTNHEIPLNLNPYKSKKTPLLINSPTKFAYFDYFN